MARLLFIQLVAGIFTLSLQMTSADVVSVHPGENVTLVCSITNYSDIFWFQVTSEELKLVLSAKRGKLDNLFSLSYSVNESHFDVTQNSSLMITGLKETDLGSYYCGAQNTTRVQLGKRITLKFTDKAQNESNSSSAYMDCKTLNIILTCVCFISFLINIICICVFSSRVRGKSLSSLTCCSDTNTNYPAEKEMNLRYATFIHQREPAEKNTLDLGGVIYAGIRHLPA
ncbi:uncharacterized protein LOC125145771 isoform X1 [Tachysurus fulvidraco]|uniref:uncharacterized protein LOC125145771 isoform X1 n=1 Tax=Tachysurus fulvidraco TaxID=1234273 RepID=UPI001FED34AC|nr:uncharacterized protein LOC125145771 isoform X1 [Tachysurus fulvidraco]